MSKIILPRQRIIVPGCPEPDAQVNFGVSGRFTMWTTKADADGRPLEGSARKVAEFDNLYTNAGLDAIGSTSASSADNHWNYVAVGTGNTPPAPTDAALVAEIAQTSTLFNPGSPDGTSYGVIRQIASSPRYYTVWKKWRFMPGEADGNLTEVGVLRGNGSPKFAVCRALITDEFGTPITLTVLPDEYLDIRYEFRVYIPEADVTGTQVIKGVTNNWTLRPVSIDTNGDSLNTGWPGIGYQGWASLRGPRAMMSADANSSGRGNSFRQAGVLVPMDGDSITTASVPSARAADQITHGAYSSGQKYLDCNAIWNLNVGNSTGITMVNLTSGLGSFQILFSPGFDKASTEKATFTLRVAWDRYTP